MVRPLLKRPPVAQGEEPQRAVGGALGDALTLHEDALGLRDHLAYPKRALEPNRQPIIGHVEVSPVEER